MLNALIMGVPRSGTSLAASIFREAGYFMGEQPLPPTPSNPKGYFEDRVINGLNNRILRELGVTPRMLPLRTTNKLLGALGIHLPRFDVRSWAHQSPKYPVDVPLSNSILQEMRELVGRQPFCFKDPRFTYSLHQWMAVVPEDTRYLVVFRSPAETITSMLKNAERYEPPLKLSIGFCERVWRVNYSWLINQYGQDPRFMFVHYDQILTGERVASVGEFFQAELKGDLATSDLARSRTNLSLQDGELSSNTRVLYKQLCQHVDTDP